jgi:D-proline reductase (dithiol) PrdB
LYNAFSSGNSKNQALLSNKHFWENMMPYSFANFVARGTGVDLPPKPNFDPPKLTPLRKPIADSTIGLFTTSGMQSPSDPRLLETEDTSFRLVHRDTPLSKLLIAHKTVVRKWAVEDRNVAFPLDRMKELEADGTIGRLAHTAVSMVGSVAQFTALVQNTVPAIKQIYDAQGVDLVFLFPF